MNRPIANAQLPVLEGVGDPITRFTDLVRAVKGFSTYLRNLSLYLQQYLGQISQQLNTQVQSVGATLASATTITPTNPIHHVSGTATIQTINPPSGFSGPIFLVSNNGYSFAAGGNIGAAGTVSAGAAAMFVYDFALWYPFMGSGVVPVTNVVSVQSVSGNTTLTLTTVETVVLADPTAGTFTVTLPPAASSSNKIVYLKNVTAGANSVTLKGNGGETIDGANTRLVGPGADLAVACNGSAWYIL